MSKWNLPCPLAVVRQHTASNIANATCTNLDFPDFIMMIIVVFMKQRYNHFMITILPWLMKWEKTAVNMENYAANDYCSMFVIC